MLKFKRNKLVSVVKKDKDTLLVHGVLDDDVYGLELDISFKISDLEIIKIDGKWNRFTTPECPRATQFLQEAVGFRVGEEGYGQKVFKVVGRKSCRHYANLLLECSHSAKEAVLVIKYQDAKKDTPELTFDEFVAGTMAGTAAGAAENTKKDDPEKSSDKKVVDEQKSSRKAAANKKSKTISKKKGNKAPGEMVIDLHVHTSPSSPCSSAAVGDLIQEAKRIGLDAICLTDHNYVWDPDQVEALRQKYDFLVLRGNEITTKQGDVVVFGMDKDIQGILDISELRQEVEEVDGFMIAAHPIRGFLVFGASQVGLTPEKAMERPMFKSVDAIEVLNGKVTEKENDFALEVAEGLGLFVTGGSDAHEVLEVGKYATRFSEKINDEKELVAALKSGNYSPVIFRKD
ncbi:MAG: PHP domain-containing protein [Deltaproteobacteria bacterium]|nr:PHP domain-containing protein [Deltaproteobacteria bacterium]MBW1847211.1 PHP domain-containing protein [Deltaproteobacteria bacterium]MBW2179499.1 PHP domain-containing protein [Deltaproteobacteria bacterium]